MFVTLQYKVAYTDCEKTEISGTNVAVVGLKKDVEIQPVAQKFSKIVLMLKSYLSDSLKFYFSVYYDKKLVLFRLTLRHTLTDKQYIDRAHKKVCDKAKEKCID